MNVQRQPLLRALERLFVAVGVAALGHFGYVTAETALYQRYENRELDAILRSGPVPLPDASDTGEAVLRPLPGPGTVIGRIEVPRLGVSAIVRVGDDAETLRLAVGYLPGTALPGEPGNIGLAGHRDTFFRRLGDIEPDDEIRLVTPEGTFIYRVERTFVVDPDDVWVLDPTVEQALTLVTCYPFTFVGAAPERFIVRAQRTG